MKKQFKEKLSFAHVLKSVQSAVNKLKEINIMKNGGRQIEMAIWFVELVMKNFLVKFAQTVFVKYVSVDEWCDCISE